MNNQKILDDILNTFQATSLILVFVTLIFTVNYPKIIADINTNLPSGRMAIKREKRRLKNSLFKRCLPQILFFGISSYIFLPLFVNIVTSFDLNLWNFDFVPTAYILITFWIWYIFLWSLFLTIQLLSNIKVFRKEELKQ